MAKQLHVDKLHMALARDIEFQAGRLVKSPQHKPHDAAAVMLSALNILMEYARVRALRPEDFKVAIDAVMDTLDIEESYTPMGQLVYVKRQPKARQA